MKNIGENGVIKQMVGVDTCVYVSKSIFAHDSNYGNYLIGGKIIKIFYIGLGGVIMKKLILLIMFTFTLTLQAESLGKGDIIVWELAKQLKHKMELNLKQYYVE